MAALMARRAAPTSWRRASSATRAASSSCWRFAARAHTLPVTCSRQIIALDSSISVVMGIGTSIAVKALFASCDDVGVRSSAFFLSFL